MPEKNQDKNLVVLTFGFRILEKEFEAVNEVGSIERVTSNTDAKGLTEANIRGLEHSLISQRARTGYDSFKEITTKLLIPTTYQSYRVCGCVQA